MATAVAEFRLPKHVGASNFLTDLKEEAGDSLRLIVGARTPNTRSLPRSEEELNARKIIKSTKDEMRAVLQMGAARILLCEDEVLIQGGEPTFRCPSSSNNDGRATNDKIQFVDPTVRPDYGIDGLLPLGYCPINVLDVCASEGALFRADEIEAAEAFVAEHGPLVVQHDTIEIVYDQKIGFDPIVFHVAAEIRSLVRHLWHIYWDLHTQRPSLAPILTKLVELSRRDHIKLEAGTSAIRTFLTTCERENISSSAKYSYLYNFAMAAIDRINIHAARRGVMFPLPADLAAIMHRFDRFAAPSSAFA